MKNSASNSKRTQGRKYVVAMVVGTALTALGTAAAGAAPLPDATHRAVHDISRYCTACWRNARLHPDSWTDCTQEVLARLMERVDPEAWTQVLAQEGDEKREFLRAIDTVKKRSQRQRKWLSGSPESWADRRASLDRQLAEDREVVRDAASKLLSPRQQRILDLSFDGWTVQDIAGEMRVSAARVSDEKYKAIRKLSRQIRDQSIG